MKVWFGYGTEHSMNLVMIGEFKTTSDAQRIEQLIDDFAEQARRDEAAGLIDAASPPAKFTDDMLDLLSRSNVGSLAYAEPVQFLFDYNVVRDGNRVIITTEESEVSVFLKLLLEGEAKVSVYSAHSHPSAYGRQTYQGP